MWVWIPLGSNDLSSPTSWVERVRFLPLSLPRTSSDPWHNVLSQPGVLSEATHSAKKQQRRRLIKGIQHTRDAQHRGASRRARHVDHVGESQCDDDPSVDPLLTKIHSSKGVSFLQWSCGLCHEFYHHCDPQRFSQSVGQPNMPRVTNPQPTHKPNKPVFDNT